MSTSISMRLPNFTKFLPLSKVTEFSHRGPTPEDVEQAKAILAWEPKPGKLIGCFMEQVEMLDQGWAIFSNADQQKVILPWTSALGRFQNVEIDIHIEQSMLRISTR